MKIKTVYGDIGYIINRIQFVNTVYTRAVRLSFFVNTVPKAPKRIEVRKSLCYIVNYRKDDIDFTNDWERKIVHVLESPRL
jgi:hypothetical protein